MKTAYILILFLLCINWGYSDNMPLVDLDKLDILFEIGKFNGKPEYADSDLETDEFKILAGSENTVQVKKTEQFPQKLKPGQRIAVFFYDIDSEVNLQLNIAAVIKKNISLLPAMELRYNRNVFYRAQLSGEGKALQFFIPKSWQEKGINVLEIRNLGISAIAFDALSLKYFQFVENKNTKTEIKTSFKLPWRIRKIARNAGKTSEYNSILRDKTTRFLPNRIIKYLHENKKLFSLKKLSSLKEFYDPYTGKPILAYYALSAVAPLFEGTPEKILCNVFPSLKKDIFHSTVWFAVRNNKYTITAAIATTPEDRKKYAEILFPVPWSGDTELEIITGIIPEPLKHKSSWLSRRSVKKEKINISDGIFRKKFNIQDLTVFRLIQAGEKVPDLIKLVKRMDKWRKPMFEKGILKLSLKRPPSNYIRTALLDTGKSSIPRNPSESYKTKIISATKSNIGKINDVTPWDSKSLQIEICYPEGKPFKEEWAEIYFQKPSGKYKQISFWVYPVSSDRKIKKVTLTIYASDPKSKKSDNKYNFLAVNLKTNIWQRVIIHADKSKINTGFRVVGNPKLPEYKKGNKVTFEFNGFCAISKEHEIYGKTALKSSRTVAGAENVKIKKEGKDKLENVLMQAKKIILSGIPGTYFEYRYAFIKPVEFYKVSALSKIKDIELIWHNDAQILEIKGKFPGKDCKISDKLLKVLTRKEKKSWKAGKTVPIGIKLLYRD